MKGGFGSYQAALAVAVLGGAAFLLVIAEDAQAQGLATQKSGTWCSATMDLRYDYYDSLSSAAQRTFNNGYNGPLPSGAHPAVTYNFQINEPWMDTWAHPDARFTGIQVGFPFQYFDSTYTQIEMGINGLAYFEPGATTNTYDNRFFGTGTDPDGILSPLWTDYVGDNGNIVYYGPTGASPNQVFVATWDSLQPDPAHPEGPFPPSNPSYRFQLKLHQADDAIEFHYDYSGQAEAPQTVVGLEDPAGVAQVVVVPRSGMTRGWDDYAIRFQLVTDIAPVGAPDEYWMNQDTTLTVANAAGNKNPYDMPGSAIAEGVMWNDKDELPCVTKTVAVATGPSDGTLNLNPDGTFDYTPDPGFWGTDSFTYEISDNQFTSPPVTVTIHVNDVPDANDDAYEVLAGDTLNVPAPGVRANDTDNDDATTTLSADSTTDLGVAISVIADGSFTYNALDGCDDDFFEYTLADDNSTSTPGRVHITVHCAPEAVDDSYATGHDTPLSVSAGVLANDADGDGDALTAVLVGGATTSQGGTVTLNADGSFTYTPASGFSGTDTFTYKASDGSLESGVATVTITVAGPVSNNNAPVAVGNAYSAAYELTLSVAAPGVLQGDSDPDGDAITAVPASGATAQGGTYTLNADGSFSYTPPAAYTGTDTFTYRVTDGELESNTATVTITIAAPTPPAELTVKKLVVGNGQSGTIGKSKLEYTDDGGPSQITYNVTVLPSRGELFVDTTKVVLWGTFTQADINAGRLSYTHDSSPTTADSFNFTVIDGHDLTGPERTFPIEILAGGGQPFPQDDQAEVARNVVDASIDVLDNDVDGDGDALSIVPGSLTTPVDGAGVQRATAMVSGGMVLFTPTPGQVWEGVVTFDYNVTDGTYEATATVTVTIQDPLEASVLLDVPAGTLCSTEALSLTATAHRRGTAPSWSWNVGDGWVERPFGLVSTLTLELPKGTFTVQAKADWGDMSLTEAVTIDVLRCEAPDSSFTCTPQGLRLRFAPSTLEWEHGWDFGDDTTSTEAAPLHRYASDGTYTVVHVVTDDEGMSSQTQQACVLPAIPSGGVDQTGAGGAPFQPAPVPEPDPTPGEAQPVPAPAEEGAPNLPPVARAGLDVFVAGGDKVTLDGSASYDPDGDLLTFQWTLLSGPTIDLHDAQQRRAWFIAPAAGELEFRLDVSDGDETVSDTVKVTSAQARSLIDWWARVDGAVAAFEATGPTDATYVWEFGDGTTSHAREPTHTYLAPGVYVVRLVVLHEGQETSSVRSLEITSPPPAVDASDGPEQPQEAPTASVPVLPMLLMASLGLLAVLAIVVALTRLRQARV